MVYVQVIERMLKCIMYLTTAAHHCSKIFPRFIVRISMRSIAVYP